MEAFWILWVIFLLFKVEAWNRLLTQLGPKTYDDWNFEYRDYEDWEDELSTEPDPSERLAELHIPNPSLSTVHHISTSLLSLTKELASMSPRMQTDGSKDVSATLSLIRTLPLMSVKELLDEHGIVVPPPKIIVCDWTNPYRAMDGSCNNLDQPCWGKAEQPYQRWLPPQYENGIDEPRRSSNGTPLPNPRQIYQLVSSNFMQTVGTTYPFYSNLLMFWGQLIAHEIALSPTVTIKTWNGKEFENKKPKCCDGSAQHPDCFPMRVDHEDSFYKSGHCLEFVRSVAYSYSPSSCEQLTLGNQRQQVNQLTSFIDASLVYGSSDEEVRKLREDFGKGAKLVTSSMLGYQHLVRGNETCKSKRSRCDKRCLMSGEKRSGENPFLGAMQTMLVREHNRLVDALSNRGWDQEKLFQEVRKIVGAMMQQITYKEYLPLILGNDLMNSMGMEVPTTRGYNYNPKANPTLYNAFVTAAFRYGHSMVNSRQKRKGKRLFGSPLLSQDFFSVDEFCDAWSDPVSYLLGGQVEQKAQKVDCLFSKELTNHLFAKTPEGQGLDLFSINIQRGRDHGIPPYNVWRQACGLKKAQDYNDLRKDIPDYVVDRLEVVYGYGRVDDIDLYVAGVSENAVNNGILGPTFTCIISNQFRNLKYGDRFWYENLNHPGAFTQAQINAIHKTTFSRLLCQNSAIDSLQRMAFVTEGTHNPKVSCSTIVKEANLVLNAWM